MESPTKLQKVEKGIWRTPGGRYKVYWRDGDGRQKAKTMGTKIKDARAFREEMRVLVRSGDSVDPLEGKVLVATAAERWLHTKSSNKPKTYATYSSDIKHVTERFGRQQLASVRRQHVQVWVSDLAAKGVGPATIRKAWAALHGILEDAVLAGILSRNAASKIKLPPESPGRAGTKALTPEQVDLLASSIDPRYRALVLVASYLGLRWAECAGLRRGDVNLQQRTMRVARSLSEVGGNLPATYDAIRAGNLYTVGTKNERVRVLLVPNFLCHELESHLQTFASDEGWVFCSPQGGPLRANVYRRIFLPALLSSGLDPKLCLCDSDNCARRHVPLHRFHDLRHTAASIAGSPSYGAATAKLVQELLGHSTQQITTETYSHLYPQDFERLSARLDLVYEQARSGTAK